MLFISSSIPEPSKTQKGARARKRGNAPWHVIYNTFLAAGLLYMRVSLVLLAHLCLLNRSGMKRQRQHTTHILVPFPGKMHRPKVKVVFIEKYGKVFLTVSHGHAVQAVIQPAYKEKDLKGECLCLTLRTPCRFCYLISSGGFFFWHIYSYLDTYLLAHLLSLFCLELQHASLDLSSQEQ